MHIHTMFSRDSKASMDDYCIKAIENNAQYICFTDHVDCNIHYFGYGFYNMAGYFKEIERVRSIYGGRLEILSGAEFSEPHLFKSEFQKFLNMPYDFIIGSIHYWYEDMFPSVMVENHVPAEICFERYWKEILKCVLQGGFNCAGHLGFPQRYYGQLIYDKNILYDIFSAMVKNNIVPEINTSLLRKGFSCTMPGEDMLSIYKSAGGLYVTIGSDAHTPGDMFADVDVAKQIIKRLGLREAVYKMRRLVPAEQQ